MPDTHIVGANPLVQGQPEALWRPAAEWTLIEENLKLCLECLLKVFGLYGFKPDTPYQLTKTLNHWLNLSSEIPGPDPWVKVAKYKLAAFFAEFVPQQVAEAVQRPAGPTWDTDKPSVLLGGSAHRWFTRRFWRSEVQTERKASFIASILYAKKGMPRPSPRFIAKAEEDTMHALFVAPVLDPAPIYAVGPETDPPLWGDRAEADELRLKWSKVGVETEISRDTLTAQIKRTVREFLSNGFRGTGKNRKEVFAAMQTKDLFRSQFPSTSANYIRSRSGAGAVGFILDEFPDLIEDLGDFRIKFDERTVSFDVLNEETDETEVKEEKAFVVDDRDFDRAYQTFYDRVLHWALLEDPLVNAKGLAEALKARVITMGPALMTYALKPVQKWLWRRLKDHPVFRLVGEPVSELNLLDSLGFDPLAKAGREAWGYFSGDYKDSTNNLYSWCSNAVAEEVDVIFRELPSQYRHLTVLFRRALTGHWALGEESEDEQEVLHQKRGQLMGSIVSFPVLCLVNAAICRWSLEISYKRKLNLRDCPMQINGDDCLFPASPEGRTAWYRIAQVSGMEGSVGKCYFSREFFNVNSTSYRVVEPFDFTFVDEKTQQGIVRKCRYKLIPYVNLGLLYGYKRSEAGGKTGVDDFYTQYGSIGSKSWELKRLTPEWLWPDVYREFLNHFRDRIKPEEGRVVTQRQGAKLRKVKLPARLPVKVPWFVPREYGGLGLVPPADKFWPQKWTDTRIALNIKAGKLGVPRSVVPTVGWQVHRRVLDRLPEKLKVVEGSSVEAELFAEEWDRLYGKLCVETLFRSSLGDIFQPEGKDDSIATLRWNERIWQKGYQLLEKKGGMELPNGVSADTDIWELPEVRSVFPCLETEEKRGRGFVFHIA